MADLGEILIYINLGGTGYRYLSINGNEEVSTKMPLRFILNYFDEYKKMLGVHDREIREMVILDESGRIVELFFIDDQKAKDEHDRAHLSYAIAYSKPDSLGDSRSFAERRANAKKAAEPLIYELLNVNSHRDVSQDILSTVRKVLIELRAKLDDVWITSSALSSSSQPEVGKRSSNTKRSLGGITWIPYLLIAIIVLLAANTAILSFVFWNLLRKMN